VGKSQLIKLGDRFMPVKTVERDLERDLKLRYNGLI
jgi:hypothetical protein